MKPESIYDNPATMKNILIKKSERIYNKEIEKYPVGTKIGIINSRLAHDARVKQINNMTLDQLRESMLYYGAAKRFVDFKNEWAETNSFVTLKPGHITNAIKADQAVEIKKVYEYPFLFHVKTMRISDTPNELLLNIEDPFDTLPIRCTYTLPHPEKVVDSTYLGTLCICPSKKDIWLTRLTRYTGTPRKPKIYSMNNDKQSLLDTIFDGLDD